MLIRAELDNEVIFLLLEIGLELEIGSLVYKMIYVVSCFENRLIDALSLLESYLSGFGIWRGDQVGGCVLLNVEYKV